MAEWDTQSLLCSPLQCLYHNAKVSMNKHLIGHMQAQIHGCNHPSELIIFIFLILLCHYLASHCLLLFCFLLRGYNNGTVCLSFIFYLFSLLFMAVVTHSCFFFSFSILSLSLFIFLSPSLSLWAKLLCRALSRPFSHNTSSYQVLLSPSAHWCEVEAFSTTPPNNPFLTEIPLYALHTWMAHREEQLTLA